jgi:2,3-bisphosphoglycerate-independent phosphoglycerate mutase
LAYKPLMLVILDGWGENDTEDGNALALAKLPNYRRLIANYPHTTLEASGEAVGLPAEQMGNSEVGHLNIGAGRVVYQELTRINKSIREGTFYKNQILTEAVEKAKKQNKAVHLMGLLSDGGVHSSLDHLYALLDLTKKYGVHKVFVHAFLDGRDVPPASAKEYVGKLEGKLKELGHGAIATVMGRYYAMDRDRRWERVAQAYKAMVEGEGKKSTMALAAVEQSYHERITDEFVVPTVIVDEAGNPKGRVAEGDTVIFFNFRADRAREITRAFIDKEFDGFVRPKGYFPVHFVAMTQYDFTFDIPVAFPPQNLNNTLGEVLSKNGLKQLRIAETEKYAHVTFFFNGGVEEPNEGEDRILIPSPKVATYNQKPEMSAYPVTKKALEEMTSGKYDVGILNYANPDMVGHTGMLDATIKACETVDCCLGKIVDGILKMNGVVIVTADHGNAEVMLDPETGMPQTAHTTDKVPFILIGHGLEGKKLRTGSLQDIAPTILELLDIPKPEEMTGESLLIDSL